MTKQTVMIALGGNSLYPKDSSGSVAEQFAYTRKTMDYISALITLD